MRTEALRTGIRNRALIVVLYRAGLRIAEALARARRRRPGPRHGPLTEL